MTTPLPPSDLLPLPDVLRILVQVADHLLNPPPRPRSKFGVQARETIALAVDAARSHLATMPAADTARELPEPAHYTIWPAVNLLFLSAKTAQLAAFGDRPEVTDKAIARLREELRRQEDALVHYAARGLPWRAPRMGYVDASLEQLLSRLRDDALGRAPLDQVVGLVLVYGAPEPSEHTAATPEGPDGPGLPWAYGANWHGVLVGAHPAPLASALGLHYFDAQAPMDLDEGALDDAFGRDLEAAREAWEDRQRDLQDSDASPCSEAARPLLVLVTVADVLRTLTNRPQPR